MKAEVIVPESEQEWLGLRAGDITSTKVGALFGCSPYLTHFELWHQIKAGHVVTVEQSERMKWGTRLQDSIAAGIAADNQWKIRRMHEYRRIPSLRIGSSFDFSIGEDGLLEVKNVDGLVFRDGWIVDGENIEAPPHIELQVQHQLLVTGRKYAYLGALVGGNQLILLKREPDESIHSAIKDRVSQFWDSINKNQEPTPDFERDAAFIAKLCRNVEPGKVLDASKDDELRALAQEYQFLGAEEKRIKETRDGVKAQMLLKIGTAEKVLADGFSISSGLVAGGHVAYDREAYRNFRVNWKKPKGEKNV